MLVIPTHDCARDYEDDYVYISEPHELSLEEKDALLFALMEHLKLKVMRANFDKSITILVKE